MTTPHLIPVIDIEASGFGLASYPIEIGLVLPNGATYSTLIKPHSSWTHWDKSAEQVHGISQSKIYKHGKNIARVCEDLNMLCNGQFFYTDCWAHDYHWLCRLYATAGLHCTFRLNPIEYLLTEQQMQTWAQRKKDYALKANIKRHRALNDALLITAVLSSELLACDMRLENRYRATTTHPTTPEPYESATSNPVAAKPLHATPERKNGIFLTSLHFKKIA